MKLQSTLLKQGPLTKQESTILCLLCMGMMRKEISRTVYRSYGCVSKQVESIAKKLDAHSTAEIVAKAVAASLVEITFKALLMGLILNCTIIDGDVNSRRPPKTPRPNISRNHMRFQREA